jgi:two-component system, NarL family, sensor kinase
MGTSHALRTPDERRIPINAAVAAAAVGVACASSSSDQWHPALDLAAFAALMIVTDLLPFRTRSVRVSGGLTVLVVIMALFGPAPAVLAGCLSMLADHVVHRTTVRVFLSNLACFATIGVVGGLMFEAVRNTFDLDTDAPAYAGAVVVGFVLVSILNFVLVLSLLPPKGRGFTARSAFFGSYLPLLPWQLTSALIAGAAVLAYGSLGIATVALLAAMLAVTGPLLRSAVVALQRADTVSALQAASDERAAEVARLASDRARLLDEVLHTSDRERGRLAEALHDGPLQRLLALRQDLDEEPDPRLDAARTALDAAMAETRAVMAAFHPITSTELGFEATVRAAAAPFLRGRVELEVKVAGSEERLRDPLLCSVARELVTNAVKHARPSLVRVTADVGEADVWVEVVDDGHGIDSSPARPGVHAGHVGLAVARRRVEDAGGRLDIRTVPTGGTHVRVSLPR